MKYMGIFGQYGIVVDADNEIEARLEVEKKFNSYKDGSRKKEFIRRNWNNMYISRTEKKNGFWI
jgi:hypothetical protein